MMTVKLLLRGKAAGVVDIYDGWRKFFSDIGYPSVEKLTYFFWNIDPPTFWTDPLPLPTDITPYSAGNIRMFEFPYDWRLDLTTTAEKLAEKIEKIKLETGHDQVFLFAHSMGGLISRKYLKTGSNSDNVKMFISMGTPYNGATKAYKILQVGDSMDIPRLDPEKVKQMAANLPGIYHLLPTEKFWNTYDEHVIGHVYPGVDEPYWFTLQVAYYPPDMTWLPNSNLVDNAMAFHETMGDDFGGTEFYVIIGEQFSDEGGEFKGTILTGLENDYGDWSWGRSIGDGTVPFYSAFPHQLTGVTERKIVESDHVALPNNVKVQEYIWDKITQKVEVDPAVDVNSYDNYGEDLDDDGVYDYLVIDLDVTVTTAGVYRIIGWLDDTDVPDSFLTSITSTEMDLSAGNIR